MGIEKFLSIYVYAAEFMADDMIPITPFRFVLTINVICDV